MSSFFNQFDGYVIPSHFEDHSKHQNAETIRYWMVTFTLTSGKVEQFYVKAKTYEDAVTKANSYKFFADLKLNGEFKLLP